MNKFITAAVLSLGFAVGAQAQTKVIYLTGATAFRGVEFSALSANIALSEAVVGLSSDNQFSFAGTWNGPGGPYPIKVYASYSGAVEGQRDLLTGALNTYKKLPTADGGAGTFTHVATLAFSDSYQNSGAYGSQFGYPTLLNSIVAVQPFVFVKNAASHAAGINNINDQTFRFIAAVGGIPVTFFKGDGDFTNPVFLSGRNNLSGTRTVVFSETGFGVFSGAQQFANGVINAVVPNTRGANLAAATPFASDDGWSSGSFVRADMNNATCTDRFVGYLSAGDARTLTGADGIANNADFFTWYLTHNGIAYSKANVANGLYTLWGYEHMFRKGDNADANAFSANYATAIDNFLTGSFCTDNFPAGLPLSAMQVSRNAEATGVTTGPITP